jgi:hypothetical protein
MKHVLKRQDIQMSHDTLLLSNIVTAMKRFCNFVIEKRGKYF